jgi:hypothetical protein
MTARHRAAGRPSHSPRRAGHGGDDRVGLDLDQHVGIDQAPDFDHRGGRTDVAEGFAVRTADRLPLRDVGDVHAGAHDVAEGRARRGQRARYVGDRLSRLRVRVTLADDRAIGAGRRRSGHEHPVPDAHRARIADQRLPARAAGKILAFHRVGSYSHSIVAGGLPEMS